MSCNLTQGHPLKQLLRFAIPLALASFAQILYSLGDMAVVGHALGQHALAAIGACHAPVLMILSFFTGLASGMTVITAQSIGAGDRVAVRRSIATCFWLTTIISILGSFLTCPLCNTILRCMNTPDELFELSRSYMLFLMGGTVTTAWACLAGGILRATGDSKTPLLASVFCAVVNIGLDLLFVRVFHWGVAGTAIATQLVHLLSTAICLLFILRNPMLLLTRKDWHLERAFSLQHLRIGFPVAIQNSLIGIGIVILQRVLNGFGPDVVAGAAAGAKIEMVSIILMFSIGLALTTYAGQNYGARRYDRIATGVRQCFLFLCAFAFVFWCLIQLGYAPIAHFLFGDVSADLLKTIRTYLRIAPSFHLLLVVIAVYRSALQGMGCGKIVLFASIAELLARSIAAPVLGKAFGFAGACFADPLAWLVSDLLTVPYYFHKLRQCQRQ